MVAGAGDWLLQDIQMLALVRSATNRIDFFMMLFLVWNERKNGGILDQWKSREDKVNLKVRKFCRSLPNSTFG